MRLILQDRFWFVHIPFGAVVRFQFLAQFPVYQPFHPVMFSLILSFAALVCYIRFLCYQSFHLYHHLLYTCHSLLSYWFMFQYDWSLWRCFLLLVEEILFLYRSHVQVFSCGNSPVYNYYCYSLRVFLIGQRWWSFIRVWVTASLLQDSSQYSRRSQ